jgi:uncharacterized protein YjbI with pentapeptide repeats
MAEDKRKTKVKTRTPPQLPELDQAAVLEALAEDEHYTDAVARGLEWREFSGAGIQLECAHLASVTLSGAKMPGLTLVDTRFEHCDLSNCKWQGVQCNRVEIVSCRALGLNAQESRLRDVLFSECNLTYADLHRSTLSYAEFEECLLNGADLNGSNLEGTRFHNCDLREADLTDCRLRGADIRGSQIDGLRVNPKDVSGMIVDLMQAAELSKLLKLVIK